GALRYSYHSCRNRHCPQCQTRAKEQWLAARQRELLNVPYFHLVFTLPHALNPLANSHRRCLYQLLFESVAAALHDFAANPKWLGGTPSFSLVLHTWQQDLGQHLHLHALVAGGALLSDGRWQAAKRQFLFPVQALSSVFRGKFMAALQQQQNRFPHTIAQQPKQWKALQQQLYQHPWVVYAKQPLGGPAQVLDYLSRYTHRVAISNERILSVTPDTVRFRVRDNHGHGKKVKQLPATEFIRRFMQHILPPNFKRIRHYGLLGNAHKAINLAQARQALDMPQPDPVVIETIADFMQRIHRADWLTCPHCHIGQFVLLEVLAPIPRAPPEAR
ncbi:MAG TPA: IS91 family transposase, partial [Pseudomonadales bacterium]|nr:IS91 family transposase [Pseudomonadales bacterium]